MRISQEVPFLWHGLVVFVTSVSGNCFYKGTLCLPLKSCRKTRDVHVGERTIVQQLCGQLTARIALTIVTRLQNYCILKISANSECFDQAARMYLHVCIAHESPLHYVSHK